MVVGGYNFDPLVDKTKESQQPEEVTLDSVITEEAQKAVAFATVLDMVTAISNVEPDSEQTLAMATLDHVGFDAADGEDGEVTCDEASFDYTAGVTLDFLSMIGVSQTAQDDLVSTDAVIASTALQEVGSHINAITQDGIDIPTLISTVQNSSMIADAMGEEDVTMDSILGADLSGVTMDWSFSKRKPKKGGVNAGGHKMVIRECMRTIDGTLKKGFCRYPKSLLNGKNYKKSKTKMRGDKAIAFANMTMAGQSARANARRSKTMKEKHKAGSKSAKTA